MAGTNQQSLDVVLNVRAKVDEAMKGMKQIQNSLGQLKLPKGLESSFEKSFGNLDGLIKKFNDQLNKGIKTKGDVTGLERITNQIDTELDRISIDFKKLTGQEIHFKIDTTEIKNAREELKKAIEDRNKFAASQADVKISKSGKSANELLDQMSVAAGNSKTGNAVKAAKEALNAGDIKEYLKQLAYVERYYSLLKKGKEELFTGISPGKAFDLLKRAISDSSTEMGTFNKRVTEAEGKLNRAVSDASTDAATKVQELNNKFREEAQAVKDAENAQKQLANQSQSLNQNIGQLESHVAMYFSFAAILRKVTQIARKAFQTVKELDAAMVETAVVTNFDVGDMWSMLPTYTENANALGSTIKDVYEAATLYYQQGLNTAQAMGLANETLKMARIGGLEAAEATDMMTAALRGFNMQINEMSAQRIDDVYSKLAAITASNTRELGSAMERTASIANSAGMAFETTSAFLAQMIETTREAPENLGTAMKTIVARFQEMKEDPTKLIDSEGEMLDANRVDKALKTIGVSLMDTNGQFRNLDDVFLEISSKWDGLTQTQQRYIATIAAGSRQQSRFIAMMQNYSRVTELVEAANNSNGASQEQFNKTLEGLDAKLNKLKNAWDQFAMGLANNKIIKLAVDGMTSLFTIINKVFGVLDKIPDPFGGVTKSLVTLLAVVKGMGFAGTILTGGVRGLGGWARGEEKFAAATPFGSMKKGIGLQFEEARTAKNNAAANRAGAMDGEAYKKGFIRKLHEINIGQAINNSSKINPVAFTLINKLYPSSEISKATKIKAAELTTNIQEAIRKGVATPAEAQVYLKNALGSLNLTATDEQLKSLLATANSGQQVFSSLGTRINSVGSTLSTFGMIIGGPVGGVLSTLGFTLITIGASLSKVVVSTVAATAAAFAHAAGIKKENAELLKQQILNGKITKQNYGKVFQNLFSKTVDKTGGTMQAIGSLATHLLKLVKPLLIIAGIAAALYGIYRAVKADEIALNKAGKAAGVAADAYSSAAQATSELRDNLSQLEEVQAGFDGLVEGTSAFNEQLVKSNELILGLLKKYPMLYDYLTTESNGRMTISDEGMDAVLEYQKNITSQAAALNTLTNGEYQAQKSAIEEKKLKKERDRALNSFNGTEEERATLSETYEKELELLEKQQETYRQSSKATAITTALSGKELNNQEAITQLYSEQYDLKKNGVNLSNKEAYQAYADFYGYDYRGNKLYDLEGNEVNVDKKDVQAVAEQISVLTTFETDAESLNSVINFANDYFKENFSWDPSEEIQGKDTFISDLLSKSVTASEDAIQEILNDDSILENLANEMSPEQVAEILGVSLDTVESNLNEYREKVIDLFEQDASLIAKAQAQDFADLGILFGRAYDTKNIKFIENQLKQLNQNQRQTILQAAQAIEKSAGSESMETLVRGMNEIYAREIPEEIDQMQSLVDGVNWDSAIERLGFYNSLIESGTEQLKNWGEEFKEIGDSSNLVTEAFEEMYDSQDFIKAMENVDKYTDSLGHFDASSIQDLSKEVGSLNNLLDTGAITTGGMARMMNLLHDNADLTLLDMNDSLIKLLNNLGEFDTLLGEAHNIIENFDPGLDTGEAGEFFVDAVEKYDEFFENNEWGNPQMRAYAEFIVGEDKFIDKLKENNGDLEKTYNDFNEIINEFAGGGYDVWERVSKATGGPADMFSMDENGDFKIDLSGVKDVNDIIDAFAEAAGISTDAAKTQLELFSNYSPDFQSQMEAKAFYNSFNENGQGYLKNKVNDKGQIVLLQSDLEKFALALGLDTGNKDELKELKEVIAGTIGKEYKDVKTIDNVSEDSSLEKVADKYSKYFMGEGAEGNDWVKAYIDEEHRNAIDVQEALSGLKEFDFTESEAMTMLWNAFKDSNQDFNYNGITLDRDKINTQEDFEAEFAKAVEAPDWVEVGELIAQGFWQYDNEKNANEKEGEEITIPSSAKTSIQSEDRWHSATEEYSEDNITKAAEDAQALEGIWNRIKNTQPISFFDKNNILSTMKGIEDNYQTTKNSIENKPIELEAEDKVDEKLEKIENNSKRKPLIIPAKYEVDVKSTGKDFKKILAKDGWDITKKQEITFTAKLEDGSVKDVTVDLSKIPDDVPIKTYVEDHFTEDTNQIIQSFEGATVNINDEAIDNFTEPTNEMIKAFWDANVGIEDWMIDNFTGPTSDAIASFAGAYVSIPVDMHVTEQAQQLLNTLSDKGWINKTKIAGLEGFINVSTSGATIVQGNGGNYGGRNGGETHSDIPRDIGGNSGGNSGGGGGGGNEDKKNPTINNFSIQEIIRYDAEKRLESYQNKLDSLEKTLEEKLEKIGTKVSSISGNIKSQKKNLQNQISSQKEVTKTYEKQLKELDYGYSQAKRNKNGEIKKDKKGKAISSKRYYENISWTSRDGTENKEFINLSRFIKKANGTYKIDEEAIEKEVEKNKKNKNINDRRAESEAIFKAAQGVLDPLVSGLEESKKKTEELKAKQKELDKQVYEAFYSWENELTKIYDLNQKISQQGKIIDRTSSQVTLSLARIGYGFGNTTKQFDTISATLKKQNQAREKQLLDTKSLVSASKSRLKDALSDRDENAELKAARKSGNQAWIDAAKANKIAANLADEYTTVSYNKDGTANIDINEAQLEKDRKSGKINQATYDAIKEKIDEMIQANEDLEDAMKSETDLLADIYTQLEEYQKTIVEVEDTLLKQYEENLKKIIDNAKKLNTSIINSLKDILDTVKKRLQERRQAEDNAKTEKDISQKQQRLNMLRANTAGGNQVEIAQLQKEINEAQQSYGRTLEDQLLDKLQQQGDAAAKQREKQIELAENQLEAQKESNKLLIAQWMGNPDEYKEQMRELYYDANGYDDKGIEGQKQLKRDFNKWFTDFKIAQKELDKTDKDSLASLQRSMENRLGTIINNQNTLMELDKASNYALVQYNKNFDASGKMGAKASNVLLARNTFSELQNRKYTKAEAAKAMKTGGFSTDLIRQGGATLKNQYDAGNITSAAGAKTAGYNARVAYALGKFKWKDIADAYGKDANRVLTDDRAKKVAASVATKKEGWGKTDDKKTEKLKEVFGKNQAAKILELSKQANISSFYKKGWDYTAQKKKNWYKYKTGGLADYTGPAWLDGTPSKPEIVLNAADTKNFVQLRDILASIMRGNTFDTPVAAGDTNIEVNINVDHIANDYDVDKLAKRIKRDIVKDSSYRNVTSAKKIR